MAETATTTPQRDPNDPRNWRLPNIGGFIMPLLFVGLVYLFARMPFGQKMLKGLFDMMPESWAEFKLGAAGMLRRIGIDIELDPETVAAAAAAQNPDDLQGKLVEQGMTPEMAAVLAGSPEAITDTLTTLNAAEVNVMDPLGSPEDAAKTIYTFITANRGKAAALMAALPRPGGTQTDKQKKLAENILGGVRLMIKDGRIEKLLEPENIDITLEALSRFTGADKAAITDLVNKVGRGPDGKLTTDFKTFLDTMLGAGGDNAAMGAALAAFMASPSGRANPKAPDLIAAVVSSMETPPAAATGATAPSTAAPAGTEVAAFARLAQALPNEAAALGAACQKNPLDIKEVMALIAQDPQRILPPFKRFCAEVAPVEAQRFVNSLTPNAVASIHYLNGQDIDVLAMLQESAAAKTPREAADSVFSWIATNNPKFLGGNNLHYVGRVLTAISASQPDNEGLRMLATRTERRDASGTLMIDYPNLSAISGLMNAYQSNPRNFVKGADNTIVPNEARLGVMNALIGMIAGDKKALDEITPQAFEGFFADASNRVAFGTFLRRSNTSALPPDVRKFVDTLRNNWRTPNGHGYSELLASPRGREFIINAMKGTLVMPNWLEVGINGIAGRFDGTDVLWVNADLMTALQNAMPKDVDAAEPVAPSRVPVRGARTTIGASSALNLGAK